MITTAERPRSQPSSRRQGLVIQGGLTLNGRLQVSGSKNAALPEMVAAVLGSDAVRLSNVPQIADTELMREILVGLGASARRLADGSLVLKAGPNLGWEVPADLGRRMRASIVMLGPLLTRLGAVTVPRPGGDDIGMRRFEQHLAGLRQMGAEITETSTSIVARAPRRLHGASVYFDLPTVTGTENIMMAATLAEGRTHIFNAAREPHVQDLARLLQAMGAGIRGAGTDEIVVDGVERLGGASHRVVSDYLEAGTYAVAVAATGGDVRLECSLPDDLPTVLLKLEQAGATIDVGEDWIRVRRPPRRRLRAVDLTTWVHPGFPTDLQAQYLALMTQAHGRSMISEFIFENRFQHVPELMRMGARIEVEGRMAVVDGPVRLHGTESRVKDIRSGAALVIAALCARGTSVLHDSWHLDRGYQDLVGKLTALGADIRRGRSDRHAASARLDSYE